jgi:hypothetical protein
LAAHDSDTVVRRFSAPKKRGEGIERPRLTLSVRQRRAAMNITQKRIFQIFFWLIVALNIWGALPTLNYAPYGAVGSDIVSVYEVSKDAALPIPVQKIEAATAPRSFVDTGKKVEVYIRNSYRDQKAEQFPRVTLLVAVVGLVLYGWTGKKEKK